MIILYKFEWYPCFRKTLFLIAFQKKTTLIGKDFWLDNNYIGNCCRNEVHSDTLNSYGCSKFTITVATQFYIQTIYNFIDSSIDISHHLVYTPAMLARVFSCAVVGLE